MRSTKPGCYKGQRHTVCRVTNSVPYESGAVAVVHVKERGCQDVESVHMGKAGQSESAF
jgi:hypothetical protein